MKKEQMKVVDASALCYNTKRPFFYGKTETDNPAKQLAGITGGKQPCG